MASGGGLSIRLSAPCRHPARREHSAFGDLSQPWLARSRQPPDHGISVRQVHQVYRARIWLSPSDDAEYDRVSKVRITAFASGVKPKRQAISCGIGDEMDDARPLTGSGTSTKSLCAVLGFWIELTADCILLMADFGDGSRLDYCL